MVTLRSTLFVALLFSFNAPATEPGPAGRWKTVDDKTGQPRAIVQIYEQNHEYFAKIEATLRKEAATHCTECKDDRKGQPIVGLIIMRHMKQKGDEYSGGDILDPDNGNVYRCKFKVADGGRKLVLRGFLGISLFGRTQTWIREPERQ